MLIEYNAETDVSRRREGGLTDLGSRTVSSTCSIAAQAMKSVKVTAAALPPVGVIVKGFRPTCNTGETPVNLSVTTEPTA